MIKSTMIGILLLCASMTWATAATITAKPCYEHNTKCFSSVYPHIELTLIGPIQQGDLANLQQQYFSASTILCVNEIEPGRFVPMTAEEYKAWQKAHQAETSKPSQQTQYTPAEKQCFDHAIPNRLGRVNGMLFINSTGGDLSEAIAIGHWTRQYRLGTTALWNCDSACIWVLASGLTRDIWPNTMMRIHRPFLTTSGLGAAGRLRALLQQSKVYFEEMGIPPELAERMFSTPPDEAKSLNDEQVSYYRLNQPDMGFQEEFDFVNAKSLGISRGEYTKRKQIYNAWNSHSPCPFDEKDTSPFLKCLEERQREVGLLR